jgi:hypothetical protein
MVDVRARTRGPIQSAHDVNESPRNQNRKRRLQVIKDARGSKDVVRVVPANEKLRAVLKHQPSGIGFRADGSAAWPNDRFTQRRLRDGSVKLASH